MNSFPLKKINKYNKKLELSDFALHFEEESPEGQFTRKGREGFAYERARDKKFSLCFSSTFTPKICLLSFSFLS